jgi:uncharacterized membrane protein required for colicin V production
MIYIDLAILLVIGISALAGMYQGFVVAVLNIAGFFISWLGALIFYPRLSQYLDNRFHLLDTIIYYAEGSSKIPTAALKHAAPASVNPDVIKDIMEQHGLPSFMGDLLADNANTEVFNQLGSNELGKYFDVMFGNIILNIISFVIILIGLRIIIGIVISAARHITDLPVLRQLDGVAGLGLGALRGILIIMVIFALLDIAVIVMPVGFLLDAIESSAFARFFYEHNVITGVIGALM